MNLHELLNRERKSDRIATEILRAAKRAGITMTSADVDAAVAPSVRASTEPASSETWDLVAAKLRVRLDD